MKLNSPSIWRRHPSSTGTLTHLTALAAKATHALLAPLGTHATRNLEHEGEFLILLDAEAGEGTLHKLGISAHETNEVAGNELSVLNHVLEFGDGGATVDSICHRGARGSSYDDLH